MGARSLFNLIVKVIGLFFIRDILEALSHTLSAVVYIPEYSSSKEAFFNVGASIPPLILYVLLAGFFIFRSDRIIRILRLDKNFQDKPVSITLERHTLLTAAVITAGAWVLVNEIPEFFRHAVYYYQERKLYVRMTRPDISYIVMSGVKLLIGLSLIIFNKPIVHLIEWGGKNKLPWQKKQALREKAEVPR
ncbi:MAG TPA: hypothetical protein VM101_13365 [Flavitalea sp.]|nr:hypothetical protein [Flavitalea sp.]